MPNSRKQWADILRGICMIFIATHHLGLNVGLLINFYMPIVLSAFLFTSGYFFRSERGILEFTIRKIKSMLLPWAFWCAFTIITSRIITFNEQQPIMNDIKGALFQIRRQNDQLWFVAYMFILSFPYYFLDKYVKLKWLFYAINFLALIISYIYIKYLDGVALSWHIEAIGIGIFWMSFGRFYKEYLEEKIARLLKLKFTLIFILVYIFILVSIYADGYKGYILIDIFGENFIIYLITISVALVSLTALCSYINNMGIIAFIGKNSLMYFALHGKALSILTMLVSKVFYLKGINLYSLSIPINIVMSFAIVSISFAMIAPVVLFVNRFIPELSGSNRVSKK